MTAVRTERQPLTLNGNRRGPADALLTPAPLSSALLADG